MTALVCVAAWLLAGLVVISFGLPFGPDWRRLKEAAIDVGDLLLACVIWPVPVYFAEKRKRENHRRRMARAARRNG